MATPCMWVHRHITSIVTLLPATALCKAIGAAHGVVYNGGRGCQQLKEVSPFMGLRGKRLYYEDSYLYEFTSTVTAVEERADGTWVKLEQSAFYPTSGGQPHDTGWLNEYAVSDVEADGNETWHRVSQSLAVGEDVRGEIQRDRRFDHMQQHCGQHILSACFEQMMGAATSSFHMGQDYATIDLDLVELTDADLSRVLGEANRWIWRDVPVRARFVTEAELADMNLRKAPSVTDDIRIVTIEGLEDNACGGTHPSSTGQVGQILVTKTERMRGGIRVTFVAGERALRTGEQYVATLRGLGTRLSVGIPELEDAVASLQDQLRAVSKREQELRTEWAEMKAEALVAAATVGDVIAEVPGLAEVSDLKRIATAVAKHAEEQGAVGFVAALTGRIGERTHVLVQTGAGAAVGANDIIKQVFAAVGGKGGGNPRAAQGATDATSGEVVAALQAVVARG